MTICAVSAVGLLTCPSAWANIAPVIKHRIAPSLDEALRRIVACARFNAAAYIGFPKRKFRRHVIIASPEYMQSNVFDCRGSVRNRRIPLGIPTARITEARLLHCKRHEK